MASRLLQGCYRSARQQGTSSNLWQRYLLSPQQCTDNLHCSSQLHTVSSLGHGPVTAHNWAGSPVLNSQQFVSLRQFQTTAATFAKRDFYEVLGVSRTASDADLKKAYFKLAKQHHPDSNKGDVAAQKKFQEVSEAYNCLKDPQQRQLHDQVGPDGMDGAEGFGGQGPFGGFRQTTQQEAEDVFHRMFGGGFGGFAEAFEQQARMKGPDLQAQLRITLKEAASGIRKTVQIPTRNISGQRDTRRVEVDIPAGIDSGQSMQLQGEGGPAAAKQGTPGSLYVTVSIAPDAVFNRRGNNIHVTVDVDFADAILGGDAKVPTLNGVKELSIKPGTQANDRLRMRGLGMPVLGSPLARGDQFVHVNVVLPRSTTQRQRELLIEFQSEARQKAA